MKNDPQSRTTWNPWALSDFALVVATLYVMIASRSKALDLCFVAFVWAWRLIASYGVIKHWKKVEAIMRERKARSDTLP